MPPKFTCSCGQLGHGDDVGVAVDAGHERVAGDLADGAGEGEELVRRQRLVAEEHDAVLEPGCADLRDGRVEVAGEVDAGDLGADRSGDRPHGELRARHDVCSVIVRW